MANVFKDISQFTLKSAATGTEEFQVSATEKVTAQQIADLASSNLKVYTLTNSEFSNQEIEAAHINDLKESAVLLLENGESNFTPLFKASEDDSSVVFITGAVPINSEGQVGLDPEESPSFSEINTVMLYVNLTTRAITFYPYVMLKKEWLQTSNIIEVGDFTAINEVWPTKTVPGTMCPFYTGSEVYSAPDATETKYVGFVIIDSDFTTQGGATVVAIAQTSGRQYIGKLDFNGQSIDWHTNTSVPITITNFKSLPQIITSIANDGEIIPIIAPASASNGPTGLSSTGPAYGYVQVAKAGSAKAYNFLIQTNGSGKPILYKGFYHSTAATITWEEVGGGNSTTAPIEITEYGGLYDASALVNAPTGSITAFHAEGTSVDGDLGPFGGKASAVSGIYIATEGSDYLETRSGIIIAYRADGEKGMAYAYCYGTKSGGGGIHSTDDWMVVENGESSGGVEKLSTWLEQGTEVAPHINIGLGEVQVPLNRALKESDILRIDFMRRSEASTFYMQGVAIVHVGAVDNSIQGYAAALDEQYVNYGTGEFAALALDANTKLIDHNYFNLYIDTNGSVPQDDYYIMGVYNISGK